MVIGVEVDWSLPQYYYFELIPSVLSRRRSLGFGVRRTIPVTTWPSLPDFVLSCLVLPCRAVPCGVVACRAVPCLMPKGILREQGRRGYSDGDRGSLVALLRVRAHGGAPRTRGGEEQRVQAHIVQSRLRRHRGQVSGSCSW